MFSFRKHTYNYQESENEHKQRTFIHVWTFSSKLISESQDDMNRSTGDYVFCEMNPGRRRQREIGGEEKNEGDEVKGRLLLMKYKAL